MLSTPKLQRTKSELIRDDIVKLTVVQTKPAETLKIDRVNTAQSEAFHTKLNSRFASPDITDTSEESNSSEIYRKICRKLQIPEMGILSQAFNFETLRLTSRGLSDKQMLAMCYTLLVNTSISTLQLDDNNLTAEGIRYVIDLLRENTTIDSLSLKDNHVGGKSCKELCEFLKENESITELNLSGTRLSDNDASYLAEVIKENLDLYTIDLSHNDITDSGMKVFGINLARNEFLRELDLSWNKLRTNSGAFIAKALKDNVTLTVLNLSMNGLSTNGVQPIAVSLTTNRTLIDLDLSFNRIYDDGIVHLAKSLMKNETLRFLRISDNPMTSQAVVALLECLKRNRTSSLWEIDISSVHLYLDVVKVLEDLILLKPHFSLLYGGVVHSDTGYVTKNQNQLHQRNPLSALKDYIASQGLRLIDLFNQFDKDGSHSVSREEFIEGLQSIKVPLSEDQLDKLISMLDTDGDGEVDFAELVAGDKEMRRIERNKKNKHI